ncbi:MAG: hypothetical protein VW462_08860, partial [Rhodospirillales bacterium]
RRPLELPAMKGQDGQDFQELSLDRIFLTISQSQQTWHGSLYLTKPGRHSEGKKVNGPSKRRK